MLTLLIGLGVVGTAAALTGLALFGVKPQAVVLVPEPARARNRRRNDRRGANLPGGQPESDGHAPQGEIVSVPTPPSRSALSAGGSRGRTPGAVAYRTRQSDDVGLDGFDDPIAAPGEVFEAPGSFEQLRDALGLWSTGRATRLRTGILARSRSAVMLAFGLLALGAVAAISVGLLVGLIALALQRGLG